MLTTRKQIVFFVLGGFFLTNAIVAELTGGKLFTLPAFVVPQKLSLHAFFQFSTGNYLYKLLIAVLITPIIYLAHGLIDRYLAGDAASADEPPATRSTDQAIEETKA